MTSFFKNISLDSYSIIYLIVGKGTIAAHKLLIKNIIIGCLTDHECHSKCQECGSEFQCEDKSCPNQVIPNAFIGKSNQNSVHSFGKSVSLGIEKASPGSLLELTCSKGYILESGKKTSEIQCCQHKTPHDEECQQLYWSAKGCFANETLPVCIPGCYPDSVSTLKSADCQVEEICWKNRCQKPTCQHPVDHNLKDQGRWICLTTPFSSHCCFIQNYYSFH